MNRTAYYFAKRAKVFAVVKEYARSIGLTPWLIDGYLHGELDWRVTFDTPTMQAIAKGKRYADSLTYLLKPPYREAA
jgi:hypothetical protein